MSDTKEQEQDMPKTDTKIEQELHSIVALETKLKKVKEETTKAVQARIEQKLYSLEDIDRILLADKLKRVGGEINEKVTELTELKQLNPATTVDTANTVKAVKQVQFFIFDHKHKDVSDDLEAQMNSMFGESALTVEDISDMVLQAMLTVRKKRKIDGNTKKKLVLNALRQVILDNSADQETKDRLIYMLDTSIPASIDNMAWISSKGIKLNPSLAKCAKCTIL